MYVCYMTIQKNKYRTKEKGRGSMKSGIAANENVPEISVTVK